CCTKVSCCGSPPAVGTLQRLVTERFLARSLRVTVNAAQRPSGEIRTSPTRDKLCMSSTLKGRAGAGGVKESDRMQSSAGAHACDSLRFIIGGTPLAADSIRFAFVLGLKLPYRRCGFCPDHPHTANPSTDTFAVVTSVGESTSTEAGCDGDA